MTSKVPTKRKDNTEEVHSSKRGAKEKDKLACSACEVDIDSPADLEHFQCDICDKKYSIHSACTYKSLVSCAGEDDCKKVRCYETCMLFGCNWVFCSNCVHRYCEDCQECLTQCTDCQEDYCFECQPELARVGGQCSNCGSEDEEEKEKLTEETNKKFEELIKETNEKSKESKELIEANSKQDCDSCGEMVKTKDLLKHPNCKCEPFPCFLCLECAKTPGKNCPMETPKKN